MNILVSGSLVFDNILCSEVEFQKEIMPDKVHMLNVSFETPSMRKEFGGCAGNIVYNVKLLGGDGICFGTMGIDAFPYLEHMKKHKINTDFIELISNQYTAQAFIITDKNNNQITAFHPGAMNEAYKFGIPKIDYKNVKIACVSPNNKMAMLRHSKELYDLNIPFIFDPGQAMGLFTGEELISVLKQATYLAVNDYEAQSLSRKTGLTIEEISKNLKGIILTQGSKGSVVYESSKITHLPVCKADKIVDPTGCGDSYRGGVLYALSNSESLLAACKLGSKMGAIKIAVTGGQNHTL